MNAARVTKLMAIAGCAVMQREWRDAAGKRKACRRTEGARIGQWKVGSEGQSDAPYHQAFLFELKPSAPARRPDGGVDRRP